MNMLELIEKYETSPNDATLKKLQGMGLRREPIDWGQNIGWVKIDTDGDSEVIYRVTHNLIAFDEQERKIAEGGRRRFNSRMEDIALEEAVLWGWSEEKMLQCLTTISEVADQFRLASTWVAWAICDPIDGKKWFTIMLQGKLPVGEKFSEFGRKVEKREYAVTPDKIPQFVQYVRKVFYRPTEDSIGTKATKKILYRLMEFYNFGKNKDIAPLLKLVRLKGRIQVDLDFIAQIRTLSPDKFFDEMGQEYCSPEKRKTHSFHDSEHNLQEDVWVSGGWEIPEECAKNPDLAVQYFEFQMQTVLDLHQWCNDNGIHP